MFLDPLIFIFISAHCFKNRKWSGVRVLVGDNVLNETHDNQHAKEYEIDHVLFHPSYEGKAYFDIAVIFTKETMEFNPKVKLCFCTWRKSLFHIGCKQVQTRIRGTL